MQLPSLGFFGSFFSFVILGLGFFRDKVLDDNLEGYAVNRRVLKAEYDFIVVGAGAAGTVVANRLTEVPHWTVLLLEAGEEESVVSEVPALPALLAATRHDWKFSSEPDPNYCLGFRDGRCQWIQGKGMGGSTMINYMMYVRGNKKDYDGWEALGNPGWGYKDVLPYFLKSEDNRDPLFADTPYHGKGSYLTVQQIKFETPLAQRFLAAGREMGYPIRDGNGEFQTGFMKPQMTVRNGERCSNNKAFIRSVRKRPNLHVSKMSMVHRVLFRDKRAVGVQFKRQDENFIQTVRARKEVIISAGTLNTPKILMLSGVGDSRRLEELEIPVVHHQPAVGKNLQDHISSGGVNFVIDAPISFNVHRYGLPHLVQWLLHRTGPFTIPGGLEGLAWVNSKFANASEDHPDIQLHFAAGSLGSDYGHISLAHGVSDELWHSVFSSLQGRETWSVLPMILRPKSRGNVTLRSANPDDPPLLYANYLSNSDDVKVLIEGIKIVIEMSKTKPFQEINSTYWPVPFPGCRQFAMFTDEYWECQLRQYTLTEHHFCGTCKMGPNNDPQAVVDPQLKVYGVKGLRVIDASIMPFVIGGNTAMPTTMIGEKGADLIKMDWQYRK